MKLATVEMNYISNTVKQQKALLLFKSKLTYVTIGLIFVSIVGFNLFSQEAYGSQQETVIRVEPGDTLWTIAQNKYPRENPQKTIYLIKKANGLESSNLKIGSELHLPVF